MVDREKLAQRLMVTFLDELRDHVATLNRELLALEAGPSAEERPEVFKLLFRAAHSLKGAARAVNVDLLERVCHQLEDILAASRSQSIEFTPALFSLFFKVIDGIDDAGTQLRQSKDLTGSPLVDLLAELEEAAAIGRNAETGNSSSPARVDQDQTPPTTPGATPVSSGTATDASQDTGVTQGTASPPALRMPTSTVRVASEKLDMLIAQTGELLVARRRVEKRPEDIESLRSEMARRKAQWQALERPIRRVQQAPETKPYAPEIRQILDAFNHARTMLAELDKRLEGVASQMTADAIILNQACTALESEVYHVRMLPFAEACSGLERAIRDIARSTGKQVRLDVRGEDVEIDRGILEALKDPLLHLIRNAIDHGIESAEQRASAGKPQEATVTVTASLRGQHVEITVQDDGRGFDLDRIREKAKSKGLAAPDDDEDVARLVFVAGFSTASIITDISGRGVGLDVVQSQIESLQGSVDVSFETDRGSCFTLLMPLTLTTTRAITVRAGQQTYAIPTANVEHLFRLHPDQIKSVAGRPVVTLGGPPLAVSRLTNTLGVDNRPDELVTQGMLAMVVASGQQQAVIVVDELIAEQDVTVKPLGSRIKRVRHVSGATLLESGEIALVLNMANVVRSLLSLKNQSPLVAGISTEDEPVKHRLLVVDDSVTFRAQLQGILDAAGFDVDTAADGQGALEKLLKERFDLVVSDVDMPRLDGFELTQAIRQSSKLARTPIVLVTARGSDEDQARGVASGADAYIVKSGFDQTNLLATIRQLL